MVSQRTGALPEKNVAIWAFDWDSYDLFRYYRFVGRCPKNSETPRDFGEVMGKIDSDPTVHPPIREVIIRGNENRRLVFQEGLFTRVNADEHSCPRQIS